MSSSRHNSLSVLQKILFSTLLASIVFILSQALASYFLLKIPCFERYYRVASGIGLLLASIAIVVMNRKDLLSAIISALVFMILSFSIGLILSHYNFCFSFLLIQYAIFFCVTVGLHFCLNRQSASKKKSKKFRFKK